MIISAWKKLSFQLLAIGALILGGNMVITDLGGVFGIHEIPVWAGISITFFTMVVVVNSYNLIDGIDGLAAGIGTIASLFFGGWFWYVGLYAEATVSFTLAGALTAFLFYNFEPASIFMGDTGSQVVGFILAFLAVRFVDFGISTDMAVPFKNEVPVLILALLIVPLYDTLRVFCIRCFQKQSPFTSDQLHVHHQLLNMGFSHGKTCLIIYSVNLSIIGMTILLSGSDVNFLFFAVLGGAIGMFSTFGIKRKILASMRIRMPSARNITTQKERLGLNEKEVGRDSKIGAFNGINRDGVEKEKEEEEELVVEKV